VTRFEEASSEHGVHLKLKPCEFAPPIQSLRLDGLDLDRPRSYAERMRVDLTPLDLT
jgi:hypothetical protein